MTKKQIDNFFVVNYDDLQGIATRLTAKYNKPYEGATLISEAYINIIKNVNKVNDNKELKSHIIRFMSCQMKWSDTPLNNREKLIPRNENIEVHKYKETLKPDLNHEREILEIYKRRNKVKGIIVDAYLNDEAVTVRELSKKFKIPVTSMSFRIKKIKQELKELKFKL